MVQYYRDMFPMRSHVLVLDKPARTDKILELKIYPLSLRHESIQIHKTIITDSAKKPSCFTR